MNAADEDDASSDSLILKPKVALAYALCIPAFFFLIDDLLGLIKGGGVFSVRSALQAASQGIAVINIDNAGLRTFFVLLCSIMVLVPSAALRVNLNNRSASFIIFTLIVAGGFISDLIYDEDIEEHLLAEYGYSRCENGDFHAGSGKSKIWFDNYVLR